MAFPAPTTVLDIIHTHPSHQGLGAGAQLVKWGTDRADRERAKCYVESSPAGYPLFRNCGFEDVAEMEIELNRYKKKGGSYGLYRYKHIVMIRPPEVDSPPAVPPKDGEHRRVVSVSRDSPIGYWDFGVAGEEDEESTGSDGGGGGGDDEEDGPAGLAGRDRRYGVVGAVGGGTEHSEAFRATSQYGVLETVSEGGDDDDDDNDDDDDDGGGGVSRRTSRFEPGNGDASRREGVSLI